jgi:hypothetical protein
MSRTPARTLLAAGCVGVVVLASAFAGCGDSGETSPPKPQDERVAKGTAVSKTAQEKAAAEFRDQMDKDAHGLLKSFESRVYDPRREGLVDHAEGEIDVRIDGKDAKYRFVYDVANKPSDPVAVEKIEDAPGVDAAQIRRVRQWAIIACCGPYAFVVFYVPPAPLLLLPDSDPKSKSLVVWAQPFHSSLNASYNLDERQVVVSRGEWTDEKNKAVTNFDWVNWHGRYLLGRSTIVQGAATEFDYDDQEGAHLLAKVRVSGGSDSGQAVFKYTTVRRRSK